MSEGFMPSEPSVDSEEKVLKAMIENVESIVHWLKYPQSYDEDEVRGLFKQAESVVERFHNLEEAEHELHTQEQG